MFSALNPVHPSVRYFMLNPSAPFAEVVKEASTVILAGGTLRPFSHLTSELLPTESLEAATLADGRGYDTPVTEGGKMTFFSCDHVVPKENIHCLGLSHGPDGAPLDFNYASRSLPSTLDSLGRTITNLCTIVPAGVVVFLPSYKYEAEVVRRWKDTGAWEVIRGKKRVFREPKVRRGEGEREKEGGGGEGEARSRRISSSSLRILSHSTVVVCCSFFLSPLFSFLLFSLSSLFSSTLLPSLQDSKDLDATLSNYSRAVGKGTGAVLFSVVGGKMSEGINFADDMARCVVVVGLPFPDNKAAELKEKMAHLDREYKAAGNKGITGSSYYFNLCMRAVNQSVGRAIRHKGDHSSIVLCDRRYITDRNVWMGLPGWIRKGGGEGGGHGRLTKGPEGNNFGRQLLGLRQFFQQMKSKQ